MTVVRPMEVEGPRGILRGMVHEPEGECRGIAVIVHGFFSATKVGPARLYVLLGRLLANLGYRVWRFDCFGVGESDGDFAQASFESELADYASIMALATSDTQADKVGDVCLVGHSLGARLAVSLASRHAEISSLLLLAPSVGKITRIENLFTEDELEELQQKGMTKRKGLEIDASFVEAMQDEQVFLEAETLHASGLRSAVFYGAADEYWSSDGAEKLALTLGSELIDIPAADHNFFRGNSRSVLLDQVRHILEKWRHDPAQTRAVSHHPLPA